MLKMDYCDSCGDHTLVEYTSSALQYLCALCISTLSGRDFEEVDQELEEKYEEQKLRKEAP